jgi:hypothetical protein
MNNSRKPFGNYAFPKSRLSKFVVPPEEDTDIEHDVDYYLRQHFKQGSGMPSFVVDELQDVLISGEYDDVIKEPSVSTVYRGMWVDGSWIMNLTNSNLLSEKGEFKTQFTYKPFKNQSSWSLDWAAAVKAAETNFYDSRKEVDEGKIYIIILHAKLEQNKNKFISCPNGLYKLKYAAVFENEEEAIGFGDIKVSKIDWDVLK